MGLPVLQWNSQTKRYTQGGRVVANRAIDDSVSRLVENTRGKLRALSQAYADGKINQAEWQIQFAGILRKAHTLAAGVAMGGKANMSQSDWGRVGRMIRREYEALNRFGLQVEQGKKINVGRVDMYARSVRLTHRNAQRFTRQPFDLARWVTTKAESCVGCLGQAARGLVAAASLPSLGSQECLSNCGCYLEYTS